MLSIIHRIVDDFGICFSLLTIDRSQSLVGVPYFDDVVDVAPESFICVYLLWRFQKIFIKIECP